MTSPLPPRLRDTRSIVDRIRQDRTNLRQLGVGFAGGRFPPLRPLGSTAQLGTVGDEGGDTDSQQALPINTDRAVAASAGVITLTLSYVPIDGSLLIHWGTAYQAPTEYTLVGKTVTFADPAIKVGDVLTAAYWYFPTDDDGPVLTVKSSAAVATGGTVTSLNIPFTTPANGDLILLAIGRASAPAGWTLLENPNTGGDGLKVYQRISDGTETSVTITSGGATRMGGIVVVIDQSTVASSASTVENPRVDATFAAPTAPSGAAISFAIYDGPGTPPDEHITSSDTDMIENLNIQTGVWGLAAAEGQATFSGTAGDPTSYWLGVVVGVTQ